MGKQFPDKPESPCAIWLDDSNHVISAEKASGHPRRFFRGQIVFAFDFELTTQLKMLWRIQFSFLPSFSFPAICSGKVAASSTMSVISCRKSAAF